MSEIERKWYVVDAKGQVLGRLATQVATILRGKHKTTFAPHLDVGDHVVVLNAAAAIRVGGFASSLEKGVDIAKRAIDGGRAKEVLERLVKLTQI